MEHPENAPNCSLYQIPPTLKISWKSVQSFSVMLLTDRQTDRRTDRRTDGQTDRQTNRQTNGQRWKHNLRHGGGNNNENITESKIICQFRSPLYTERYHHLNSATNLHLIYYHSICRVKFVNRWWKLHGSVVSAENLEGKSMRPFQSQRNES